MIQRPIHFLTRQQNAVMMSSTWSAVGYQSFSSFFLRKTRYGFIRQTNRHLDELSIDGLEDIGFIFFFRSFLCKWENKKLKISSNISNSFERKMNWEVEEQDQKETIFFFYRKKWKFLAIFFSFENALNFRCWKLYVPSLFVIDFLCFALLCFATVSDNIFAVWFYFRIKREQENDRKRTWRRSEEKNDFFDFSFRLYGKFNL